MNDVSSRDLNEADLVQNAALGAALIWQFGVEYQEKSLSVPPPMPLAFVVLPVCLHSKTLEGVLSTRKNSGLTLFAGKVGEVRENLFAIHPRAVALRQLSLQSIGIGVRAGLLSVDYENAAVRSNGTKSPVLPERIKQHWNAAGRFGYWCAGLQLNQIATLLKVDF